MKRKYLVLIEKGETSYGAYAPDVAGCAGIGETPEEALQSFREVLQFHLEGTIAGGEPAPDATYIAAEFVEVEMPSSAPVAS